MPPFVLVYGPVRLNDGQKKSHVVVCVDCNKKKEADCGRFQFQTRHSRLDECLDADTSGSVVCVMLLSYIYIDFDL